MKYESEGLSFMKSLRNIIILLSAILSLSVANTDAQAPSSITYQGRLTDAAGTPTTTPQSVTFRIYASASSTIIRWEETLNVTPDAQGVFTVILGSQTALNGDLFQGSNRYLALKIGDDTEMTPRQLLSSVPYAISATNIPDRSVTSNRLATGAVTNINLADGAITSDKILDNSILAEDLTDEAGLAYKISLPANSFRMLPATGTDTLASITVSAPGAGYIYVWGMTNVRLDHINGTRDLLFCQISPAADTIIPNSFGFAMVDLPADMPTDQSYIYPINIHRPFQVVDAGNYTYYFNAKMFTGGGNNDQFHSLQLTAFFFPTAYGEVNLSPPPVIPIDQGHDAAPKE